MAITPDLEAARRILVGCSLALLLNQGAAAQSTVRINGTGSGTGGMHVLAKAFMQSHPDVKVEVQQAVGSTDSIGALMTGGIELAVSNRKPRNDELASQPLLSIEYARTPFVVVVSSTLTITALTSSQLARLYGEGIVKFPNGMRARPVLRRTDAGNTHLLKSISPEVANAVDAAAQRRGMLNAGTDSEAADMTQSIPGAFTVSTLALIESEKRPLTALAIDGKVPSVANLGNGSYPYFKSLYMIVNPNAGADTKAFAAFVQSAKGRALLRAHGHAPS